MTNACFNFKTGLFQSFEISGHSGYQDQGSDIVCSGISTATFTSLNLLLKYIEDENFELIQNENDGYILFKVINFNVITEKKFVLDIINNLIDMLKQIEANYKNHLKVKVRK